MLDFQLFRIKVYPSKQADFFREQLSRDEILLQTITSLPTVELRKDKFWYIGNVAELDDGGLYFRVGRMSKLVIGAYRDGKFTDEEVDALPYTHGVLDASFGLLAIAKKTSLNRKCLGIARQFVRLLKESERARQLNATFEVDEISSPEDFISYLKRAYTITQFWVEFSRPNPWDIEEEFLKTLRKVLEEVDGDKGKTTIRGDDLNPERLEAITRSVAPTGDNAGASLQLEEEGETTRRSLKEKPVYIQQEDVADEGQQRSLLERLRKRYKEIRGDVTADE